MQKKAVYGKIKVMNCKTKFCINGKQKRDCHANCRLLAIDRYEEIATPPMVARNDKVAH